MKKRTYHGKSSAKNDICAARTKAVMAEVYQSAVTRPERREESGTQAMYAMTSSEGSLRTGSGGDVAWKVGECVGVCSGYACNVT